MKEIIQKYINWGLEITSRYVVLRYLISGGMAGVTDLLVLYFLNTILGIHYLISAVLAFIIAFGVSFTMHKFWTFKSHEQETHKQVVLYFGTSLFGLSLNTLLMYLFVDFVHLNVLLSQIIVGFLVASVSFFISRSIVFKYKQEL